MPTSAGVNPSLTIAANALRAAHRLVALTSPSLGVRPCRVLSLTSPFWAAARSPATHSRTLRSFHDEVRCFMPAVIAPGQRHSQGLRRRGPSASIAAALADERIDTVLVATPPASHLGLALTALEHGKNVIVEKPAFPVRPTLRRARAAQLRSGRRVLVAENYCYKPLARTLQTSALGRRWARSDLSTSTRRSSSVAAAGGPTPPSSGGGALLEGGVHWVDLLANLGLRVETVHGFRPGDWQGSERSMLLVAEYEEGAVGTLAHSWEFPRPAAGCACRGSTVLEGRWRSNRMGCSSWSPACGPGSSAWAPRHRWLPSHVPRLPGPLRTGSEPRMTLGRAQRGLESSRRLPKRPTHPRSGDVP